MTIQELAEILRADLVTTYYPGWTPPGWSARFDRCELASIPPGGLVGEYGTGPTPTDALADYVQRIKGRTLIFDATSERRREFVAPRTLTAAPGAPK